MLPYTCEVFAVGVDLRAVADFAVGVHADLETGDAAGDADAGKRSVVPTKPIPELALPVLKPWFAVNRSYSA